MAASFQMNCFHVTSTQQPPLKTEVTTQHVWVWQCALVLTGAVSSQEMARGGEKRWAARLSNQSSEITGALLSIA